MRCIFCKNNSDNTKSAEHIIPESMGNKSHILKNGIVCDKCNDYFGKKIERQVLELSYFKSLRHRNEILTKKNRLPTENAYTNHSLSEQVEIVGSNGNILEVNVENKKIFESIINGSIDKIYVPILKQPEKDNLYISRFLGKVAIEALADKLCNIENWNNEFVEHEGLDDLRNYVRYGKGKFWKYNQRKVYEEYEIFKDFKNTNKPKTYQTLYEYDFLYIDEKFLFFVCIILGTEYVINMREPNLELYYEWLKTNDNKGPLERDYQIKK